MPNLTIWNTYLYPNLFRFSGKSAGWVVFLCALFFPFSSEVLGQEPNYTHDALNSKNLDYFTVTIADALSFQEKIDRLIIAVDVSPDGEQYVLTFGDGIKRVNGDNDLEDFIPNTNNRLSNAMDFAINSDGKFFVATNESNRRFVRVYSPEGNYLINETLGDGSYETSGANKFRGPVGLTFDNDDNLYVADHYIGNENPTRPSGIKIYFKDGFGSYKGNLLNEFDNVAGTLLNFPYRIAVNSEGHLYMAELGQNNIAKVRVLELDPNFNPVGERTGPSAQLGAPGSILIDKFDNIFIADFGNEINLPRFLEATGDINEFSDIFEIIKEGIENDDFNINVYNSNNTLNSKIPTGIDFPIDLAISNCGTLFVNNAIFEGEFGPDLCIPFIGCFPNPDISLDFDLEVYQRSPGYDTEAPVLVSCPDDQQESLTNGIFIMPNYTDLLEFTDNCDDDLEFVQDPPEGSTITETTEISIIAIDDNGNISEPCLFDVIIDEEEDSFEINCPPTQEEIFDENCQFEVPDYTAEMAVEFPDAEFLQSPEPGTFISASTSVSISAIIGNQSDSCSFQLNLEDGKPPVIDCPNPRTKTFNPASGFEVPDYRGEIIVSDNCSSEEELKENIVQTPAPGEIIYTSQQISFTVEDVSENTDNCSFQLTLVEEVETPVAKCKNPTVFLDQNGQAQITADDLYDGDPVEDGVTLEINRSLFTCADIGDHDVLLEITASNGETVTCTAIVYVRDNTPPSTDCSNMPLLITYDGEKEYTIPDFSTLFTSSDNCSVNLSYSQTPEIGTILTENTIAIFSIEDETGYVRSCSFPITFVEEDPQPTISCPSVNDIPPLYLDNNCEYEETDFRALVTVQNSTNATVLVSTVTRNNNMLTVKMELREAGTVVDECIFFVNLLDKILPTIDCPASPVLLSPNEDGEFVISDYSGRVSDNCDQSPEVIQDPLPGSIVFEDTPVRITAKDDSNEEVVVCEFMVNLDKEEPGNEAPVAQDDFYSTPVNVTKTVPVEEGVLLNDNDEEGDDLTAILMTPVQDGTLNFNADGSFTYVPDPGYIGTDNFTYRANDGELVSNIATVRIEVTSNDFPNFVPLAVDEDYFTPFETSLTIIAPGVLENDDDGDDDPLTAVLENDVQNGELTLNPDGSFAYVPEAEFSGEVYFTYFANDGKDNSLPAKVTITVGSFDALAITCPPTQTDVLDVNCRFLVPDYRSLAQVSNEDAVVTQDPPMGEIIYSGGLVTLTATLGGEVVSCSFQLDLEGDTTKPVASCVSQFELILSPDGTGSITAQQINLNSTDNCGDVSLSLDQTSFTTAHIGENTVTLTVTDNSGNTATCTTLVTVVPYEVPGGDFNCRTEDIILSLDNDGNAVLKPEDVYTGSPGNTSFTLSKTDFSCSNIGSNTVTITYTGENQGTCTVKVLVEDEIAPVVRTRNISMFLNSAGIVNITPELINDGSTDNCGSLTYSIDRTSLRCKDIGENVVTLTVTDASGNDATGTAVVTLTGTCEEEPEQPEDSDEYIYIYPNPTVGPVYFHVPRNKQVLDVELYDTRGRFILKKEFPESTTRYEVDLSGLQSSVYIFKVNTGNGYKILRVIVK